MKIVFDIMHPAHVNFFKNIIGIFEKDGNEIIITVLERGRVPVIVRKEFPGYRIRVIGKHSGTTSSILFQANILRFFSMFFFLIKEKPDIGFSVGSFILGSVMKILRRSNYQFDDDPERRINVFLEKITSTKVLFPYILYTKSSKVELFNSLKEWAYLSPKYFVPDLLALNHFNLIPYTYIFVREVSTGSLNYAGQSANLISKISLFFPEGIKVLLSLEDKSTAYLYPKDWIILKEPVDNIHSLIFFSRILVSSGDSMAREGAMLGVPSIYCGNRTMKANKILENKGILFHVETSIAEKISELINDFFSEEKRHKFRNDLLQEWDDINLLLWKLYKPI